MGPRSKVRATQLALVLAGLALWEWGYQLSHAGWPGFWAFDPYFISTPSAIARRFLRLACLTDRQNAWTLVTPGAFSACVFNGDNNLLVATAATLRNTFWGFLIGMPSGVLLGLLLGRSPFLASVFEPFIVAFNSVPRIALAPVIIVMLGFGDASKIVTSWLAVIILVFFNTFEGARSVDKDYVASARILGATRWQIMLTVIIPSVLAWVFAILTPAASFALIGVIVAEFIGANFGLGRLIVDAQSRADAADMMIAVMILAAVGVSLSAGIKTAQRYLLRWQAHYSEA